MKQLDLHVHTTYSDGKNTPEEMIAAALEIGMETIGFSDHSYTDFDESYCIPRESVSAYRGEIAALKEKYKGRIEVLCGIEQDYFSEGPAVGYDYVIGSVHYIKAGTEYIPVDKSVDVLKEAAEKYFCGDIYALAEEYYRLVGDVVRKTGANIVGHFDLITKFIEKAPILDVEQPRYRKAWRMAADSLLREDVVFEINTGAISRGYRTTPYPMAEIYDHLKKNGAKFILSSDSHSSAVLKLDLGDFPYITE